MVGGQELRQRDTPVIWETGDLRQQVRINKLVVPWVLRVRRRPSALLGQQA